MGRNSLSSSGYFLRPTSGDSSALLHSIPHVQHSIEIECCIQKSMLGTSTWQLQPTFVMTAAEVGDNVDGKLTNNSQLPL
mmetsp:Transcript_3976/g.11923  ORF Transcript_3976/g.11923 Transcript_3976/m.11923 type:complete len:80 (-) Transcript_3976:716-955(-)